MKNKRTSWDWLTKLSRDMEILWNSEEDTQGCTGEEQDYTETAQELMLRKIEEHANKLLDLVKQVQTLIKEEKNND